MVIGGERAIAIASLVKSLMTGTDNFTIKSNQIQLITFSVFFQYDSDDHFSHWLPPIGCFLLLVAFYL